MARRDWERDRAEWDGMKSCNSLDEKTGNAKTATVCSYIFLEKNPAHFLPSRTLRVYWDRP